MYGYYQVRPSFREINKIKIIQIAQCFVHLIIALWCRSQELGAKKSDNDEAENSFS